tara:strand:+ start:770 stop:1846 length:1077 start_codon:yes stop_codon:yes gene_type:complete
MSEIIKGSCEATVQLRKLVEMVSISNSTVLLRGETGCGKDVVARAIHNQSKRNGNLINVNCAAIPAELLESELFGHEKGAFTGAESKREGRFEASHNGTLFLDEIGDMPLPLQAKLLRAIETKKIQRVGGKGEIDLDLRLICATHQNIEKKIEEGLFRADLFYRINVFPIEIPTLAERKEDIPELVEHILNEINKDKSSLPSFEDSAFSALKQYIWPGNVRELRNVIERSTIIFASKKITAKNIKENLLKINLPDVKEEKKIIWEMTSDLAEVNDNLTNSSPESKDSMPHPNNYKSWFEYLDQIDLRRHLSEVECILIEGALKKNNGSVTEASKGLKINRTTLIEKMKKYSIPRIGND